MSAADWITVTAILAAIIAAPAVIVLVCRPSGTGRHVLGRPVFDGDNGGWPARGPAALLLTGLPAIDWAAAPPPDMAENHADALGCPRPHYTDLEAWRAEEEAAERLAHTAERRLVTAIIRGLEYRDSIDERGALIMQRALADLS